MYEKLEVRETLQKIQDQYQALVQRRNEAFEDWIWSQSLVYRNFIHVDKPFDHEQLKKDWEDLLSIIKQTIDRLEFNFNFGELNESERIQTHETLSELDEMYDVVDRLLYTGLWARIRRILTSRNKY